MAQVPMVRVPLAGASAAMRRMVAMLLDEAAAMGGGARRSTPWEEALSGGTPGSARRAAEALANLLPTAPAPLAPAPPPPEGHAARQAWTRSQPLAGLAALTILARGGAPLLQRLGPRRPPPDLRDALCRRILAALGTPQGLAALPRMRPDLPLLLDMPAEGPAPAAPLPSALALVALAAAAEPSRLARRFAELRASGWASALLLPGAASLRLLDPGQLAAELYVVEDPGEALPERGLPAPLALVGHIGPGALARAAEEGWPVEQAP